MYRQQGPVGSLAASITGQGIGEVLQSNAHIDHCSISIQAVERQHAIYS